MDEKTVEMNQRRRNLIVAIRDYLDEVIGGTRTSLASPEADEQLVDAIEDIIVAVIDARFEAERGKGWRGK